MTWTFRQIGDRLQSEVDHGADVPSHYNSPSDIEDAIVCVSNAQKMIDDGMINCNDFIGIIVVEEDIW